MGFRYRNRIKLAKGLWINLSKSGASLSAKAGPFTVNSRGRTTTHIAPGLSYVSETPKAKPAGQLARTPKSGRANLVALPNEAPTPTPTPTPVPVRPTTARLIDAAYAAGFAAGQTAQPGATAPDGLPAETLLELPAPEGSPRFRRRVFGLRGVWFWMLTLVAMFGLGSIPGPGPLFFLGILITAIVLWRRAPFVADGGARTDDLETNTLGTGSSKGAGSASEAKPSATT
ncbi:MAG TPA: DUF4236 domain-containing protein [Microbacteriaceae bacterium]|nr:DUF4236 domain-containing protein [Microbacteriaceae bacterium]